MTFGRYPEIDPPYSSDRVQHYILRGNKSFVHWTQDIAQNLGARAKSCAFTLPGFIQCNFKSYPINPNFILCDEPFFQNW